MWQCPECTFLCEMDGQCKCGFLLEKFEDISSLIKEVEIEQNEGGIRMKIANQNVSEEKDDIA
jgi:hypothetical protein